MAASTRTLRSLPSSRAAVLGQKIKTNKKEKNKNKEENIRQYSIRSGPRRGGIFFV
jgi:hypothetical protein